MSPSKRMARLAGTRIQSARSRCANTAASSRASAS
ncbi:Uncharacterised protein [Bordetella pertussis]|nr:Uncharacterised protein [Bordetella pertussis]